MNRTTRETDLPLRVSTPDAWGHAALLDVMALLNDHAHLEKKAASNALELLHRWPEPTPPQHWAQVMTAVARDEVDHLATVTRMICRRGGRLSKSHRNPYANALRDLVRLGDGKNELMDRLMVSALIEARSCERFQILARACADRELARLYERLSASEQGHYRVFLELASSLFPARTVQKRWGEMLDAESRIIQDQEPGPRMHSWVEVRPENIHHRGTEDTEARRK